MKPEHFGWLHLLNVNLFQLGGAQISAKALLSSLIALLLLLRLTRALNDWLVHRALAGGRVELGTRETAATLIRYVVLVIGIMAIVNAMGIQLSSFTMLAGAVGVGVGFGLQNIISNFISGLIVMVEHPVEPGDHVVVAGVEGDVITIGARATTLLTAQGSLVVVPNQAFITGNVVNWTVHGVGHREILKLRLSGDPGEDEALLIAAVSGVAGVLADPPPRLFIDSIDHAGRDLELQFAVTGDATQRLQLRSAVQRAILDALASHQRELAP